MTEDENVPAATPSGNQNLIIGLVLGAVVLLLLLLVIQMMGGGFGGSSKSRQLDDLKKELEAKRSTVNQERARLGLEPLPGGPAGQSVDTLSARISNDSQALASLANQMQTLLIQQKEELSGAKALYASATSQVGTLQQQLDQARLSASDAETLRSQLAASRGQLERANQQILNLQQQLANAPDASDMSTLRSSLEETIKQRDSFKKQVSDLEDRIKGMVDGVELTALTKDLEAARSKLAKLEPENNQLRYEIQRLRSELNRTRLFIEKADDLPAAAKQLFVELSKLETVAGAKLKEEYQRIDSELKARVVETISFPTNSSRIDHDRVEEIRRKLVAADDKSYFLVVGYASKTGTFEENRKLSSDRATTVASVSDFNKKETQGVNAVFLGQTDRFSPSDVLKNQICEIWEIRTE